MPHEQEENAEALREWSLQEQWEIAKNGVKEASAMHDRIKARLFNVLALSVTLCSASGAASYSGKGYALPCGTMLGIFALCAACCIAGLWSTNIITTDISPETFDALLNNASPPPTNKAAGMRQMAEAFYDVSLENTKAAVRDRRWLKASWTLLLASPLVGLLVAILLR